MAILSTHIMSMHSPDRPLISIITAVYNGEGFIENAIQSVLSQTYPHIEYIIIDGGSTDKTVSIIETYQNKLHYWISEKDKGVYDAWNKGLAKANGEWIAFLGADDVFYNNNVIEEATPDLNIALNRNIRYVYGKVQLMSVSGKKFIEEWGIPWEESKKNIFRNMTLTHCGAFHHKSLFKEYGNFDDTFKITGDYEFILREFSKQRSAYFIDRPITAMRAGGISANLKHKLTVAKENIKALKLNHIPTTFHHTLQVWKAYLALFIYKLIGGKQLKKLSDFYRKLKGEKKMWSQID